MNKPNYLGLTKEEYTALLKKHNMCTKKWTLGRWKEFDKERKAIIKEKNKTGIVKRIIKKMKEGK